MKHEELKAIAEAAVKAHNDENARLVAMGLNSKARYPMLKELREAKDAAWANYVQGAHAYVRKELDKVIAAGRPARKAAEQLIYGEYLDQNAGWEEDLKEAIEKLKKK